MRLFTGLKKIREFERLQLPFLKSVGDFDIVIEIGYAEEQRQPLTLKQLFLLNINSRTTVRRKLARLIEQGIVIRRKHANDHRANLLMISPSSFKLLSKYGGTLSSISTLHFKQAAENLSVGTDRQNLNIRACI
jgi:DNA-binding MarR family transcriptional regulator